MDVVDESIWRSLLVACGGCGGSFMRRIAMALFDAMKSVGIAPNVLTFGQYTNALAKPNSINNEDTSTIHIDDYMFLEHAGVAWYAKHQRAETNGGRRDLADVLADGPSGALVSFLLSQTTLSRTRLHDAAHRLGLLTLDESAQLPIIKLDLQALQFPCGTPLPAEAASTTGITNGQEEHPQEAQPEVPQIFGIHSMSPCQCGHVCLDEEVGRTTEKGHQNPRVQKRLTRISLVCFPCPSPSRMANLRSWLAGATT